MPRLVRRCPARQTTPSACVIDALEQRTLLTTWAPPTGDASVFLRDGDLIVRNAQGTELSVHDGRIYARPRSHFTEATVNGGENFSASLDAFDGDIIVDGYFFTARGFTTPNRLVVRASTRGFVQLKDMTISGDLEVATQTEVSIVDTRIHGSANIIASRSFYFSGLYHVTIAQDLIVSGSPLSDSFSMNDGVVHGKTFIRTGSGGGDTVSLNAVQFEGATIVNTGSGEDRVNSSENEFARRLIINGSRQADSINSTDDSFSGFSYLKGGSGKDSFSIESPMVWGTDEFFSRFSIFGEGGDDSYEMTDARFTEDRFSVSARRSVWEPQSEDETIAITLANAEYPANGGMPIHLQHERDRRYVVTYPVRAADFFGSGRRKLRVDLDSETVSFLPPNGGRSRPVEFTDLELESNWWHNLPS